MDPNRTDLLTDQQTFRFQIQLDGFEPPSGARAAWEQRSGKPRDHRGQRVGERETGRPSGHDRQKSAPHRSILGPVHAATASGADDALDRHTVLCEPMRSRG